MNLSGDDVVLVTGGASGLGAATARAFAARGAQVLVMDLPSAASAVGDWAFAGADVRDEDQVQAGIEVARALGPLRVVVNCAGVATPGRILGKRGILPLADFKTVVDINLVGTFNVVRLAAAAMAENDPLDGDRGVIVMTASVAAFDGQIGQAAYSASKGGIAALTISAARDLASKQIRVVTIAPGVMETPMMAGLPGETQAILESQVPHPSRLGRPGEYAMLAEHIVANPLLNGETIRLDGALRLPPR